MRRRSVVLMLAGVAGLSACGGPPPPHTRGVYLLVDTSGTYVKQEGRVKQIIGGILLSLQPEDSVAVARIDTASFSEKNIIARQTFDDQESTANRQKILFREKVFKALGDAEPAPYTDITGGLLQAIEYLHEKDPARKEILIFSDMEEDLAKGYVRDVPLDLKGIDVVALNVTKLRADNFDPRKYMARIASWKARVEKGGGRWKMVNDVDHLDGLL
jgi:hypothetical protein